VSLNALNNDPGCTFGGNLQPSSATFPVGVKLWRPWHQIEPCLIPSLKDQSTSLNIISHFYTCCFQHFCTSTYAVSRVWIPIPIMLVGFGMSIVTVTLILMLTLILSPVTLPVTIILNCSYNNKNSHCGQAQNHLALFVHVTWLHYNMDLPII